MYLFGVISKNKKCNYGGLVTQISLALVISYIQTNEMNQLLRISLKAGKFQKLNVIC